MTLEFICQDCASKLEHVKCERTVLTGSDEYEVESCELCRSDISSSYYTLSSIEISSELIQELNDNIHYCYMEGCGRAWDYEDGEYLSNTNSNLIELLESLISGDESTAYLKALNCLSYHGDLDSVSCPTVKCGNCGVEIDEWETDITIQETRSLIPNLPDLPQAIQEIQTASPAEQIEYFRSDCSPFLIHLTRGREIDVAIDNIYGNSEQTFLEAPQMLWLILKNGLLKANQGPGMKERGVCFTEKPLSALKETLIGSESRIRKKSTSLRWQPYGIMFTKEYLKSKFNVRPVLPVKDIDESSMPETLRHLFVSFRHDKNNWLHEREWRSQTDVEFDLKECIILLPDYDQIEKFRLVMEKEKMVVRGFLPLFDVFAGL